MTAPARLQAAYTAARRALAAAEEACPHWDYEGPGEGHTCCDELADAEERVRRLGWRMRDAQARAAEGGFWDEYTSA